MTTTSLTSNFLTDEFTDLAVEWPSEISNSMEWSIQVLDAASYAVGERNPQTEK